MTAGSFEESIDGDALTIDVIDRYARGHFWDDGAPRAGRHWPQNLNVPIALMNKTDMPPKGTWRRYGADIAVASFWYAFSKAKEIGAQEAELDKFRALCRSCGGEVPFSFGALFPRERRFDRIPTLRVLNRGGGLLRRNVPFTFCFFESEAKRLAKATEVLDSNEDLREFFGLDCTRLIAVVQAALKHIADTKQGAKATKEDVASWLRTNVRWSDTKRCPSANVVGILLTIGSALAGAPRARAAMALARAHVGRASLYDEYSKVAILCQRSNTPQELEFLVEYLTVRLLRGQKENPSQTELRAKAGEVIANLFDEKGGQGLS